MGDVVDLESRRKKKPPPSPGDVVAFCTDDVMLDWERFAKTNKLNDFITNALGVYGKPFTNYLANPKEVQSIEDKIGLLPGVWAPGINGPAQLGWRACFRFGEILVETPDLPSEAYARCCNVLIFLKVKRQMVELNKPTK